MSRRHLSLTLSMAVLVACSSTSSDDDGDSSTESGGGDGADDGDGGDGDGGDDGSSADGSGDGTGDGDGGDDGGNTGADDGDGGSSGADDGSTSAGDTSGGGACNEDGTCDPDEDVFSCPEDCPSGDPPEWCDSVVLDCDLNPKVPGLHHDVCVTIEEGRWTSNPTYDWVTRDYTIYVPDDYDGSTPTPLYVWLHNYDVSQDTSLIEMYADSLDTPGAMASPDDTGAIWVAPISPDNWSGSEWSFAWQTLQAVTCIYNVNMDRIYLGGMGSGGSQALFLGYKDMFGIDYLAAIGAYSVGNTVGTLIDTEPCDRAREVPTFLASGGAIDVNRGKVAAWLAELESCYDPGNYTFYQYPSGNQWTPETFGQQEWPWVSGFTLP